jgi:uncharacterized protein (TIGR03083 family)
VDLAGAYRDGRQRLTALVTAPGAQVDRFVPLTPAWRVRDVVAHVTGVAEDLLAGSFPDFSDPKAQPEQALAREQWTEQQVQRRRDLPLDALIAQWEEIGQRVETALAADPDDARYPLASRVGATFDLGCHLHDVRHALGQPGDREAPVTRTAFSLARGWLDLRLQRAGAGQLRLVTPDRTWDLGTGEPAATVEAPAFELFRAISGRRSRDQILALAWTGDAEQLLEVLSPYPLPELAVVE